MVIVEPGNDATAAAGSPKVCSGWKPPTDAPWSRAAPSASTSVTPLQCTTDTSGRQRSEPQTGVIAASGVVRKTRSQASTTACGAMASQPAMPAASSFALAALLLATALTYRPAAAKLKASALPRRPAPMKPMRKPVVNPSSRPRCPGESSASACRGCTRRGRVEVIQKF